MMIPPTYTRSDETVVEINVKPSDFKKYRDVVKEIMVKTLEYRPDIRIVVKPRASETNVRLITPDGRVIPYGLIDFLTMLEEKEAETLADCFIELADGSMLLRRTEKCLDKILLEIPSYAVVVNTEDEFLEKILAHLPVDAKIVVKDFIKRHADEFFKELAEKTRYRIREITISELNGEKKKVRLIMY